MMISLGSFISSVLDGKVIVPTSGESGEGIAEYFNTLKADDVEAIAAEAIHQDVVDFASTTWDALVTEIRGILDEHAGKD